MNPDDYDEDGNNIVPCPLCGSTHCPGNEFDRSGNRIGKGVCPEEEAYVQSLEQSSTS
jgi:hypothetical protein